VTGGRPSLDHLRHLTPQGSAHAPTVRASMVVAPTQRDRPRGRGTMIAIAALAAVAVVAVVVVISQRGGGEPSAREPDQVAVNAPAGGPPAATEPPPVEAPPPPPAQTPPAQTPPITAPKTAPPPPPRTATPPAPPPVAPPKTGPTIVGGGSAADHGVHIGPGVTMGSGVIIGGSPSAPPSAPPAQAKSFTLPIDYNPKKFDGPAYARKALALARRIFPDAKLTRYDIANVYPSGFADLTLTDDDSTYWFRSPSHSARPAGIPKNIDVDIECYVEVEVGPREIRVWARDLSIDENCQWKLREPPVCTASEIWGRAKDEGAEIDTVAKVAFLSDGTWFFDNDGGVKTYKDDCR